MFYYGVFGLKSLTKLEFNIKIYNHITVQFFPPSTPATQQPCWAVLFFFLLLPLFFPPSSEPSSDANDLDTNANAFGEPISVSKLVYPERARPSIEPANMSLFILLCSIESALVWVYVSPASTPVFIMFLYEPGYPSIKSSSTITTLGSSAYATTTGGFLLPFAFKAFSEELEFPFCFFPDDYYY